MTYRRSALPVSADPRALARAARRHVLGAVAATAAALFTAGPAGANPVSTDTVTAELVPVIAAVTPGEPVPLVLRLDVRAGWHVYWRNPGDSGLPPTVAWTLPGGVAAGPLRFPTPERFPVGPLVNYGYGGEVLFPTTLATSPALTGRGSLPIEAAVDWLVCADICIPESATLGLALPVGSAASDAARPDLGDRAAAALPVVVDWPARGSAIARTVRLEVDLPVGFRSDAVPSGYFPFEDGMIDHAAPQRITRSGDRLTIETTPGYRLQTTDAALDLDGLIVFADPDRGSAARSGYQIAVAIADDPPSTPAGAAAGTGGHADPAAGGDDRAVVAVGLGAAGAPTPAAELSVSVAIGFAVLGGLLLNLMPCVFPVLMLKALGALDTARVAPARARAHGLAYGAGVLATFGALAGVLVTLIAAGAQIGWGFQLQSPLVVAGLAYLFLVVGLNLSGMFAVGTGVMGLGGGVRDDGSSLVGSAATGALAVVVATPCTAPFMGAAVGYALGQPPATGVAVFLALGVGMASPFVLLSFAPAVARRLPRPGPWMERLRQVMAFPMYATAVWLVWVLGRQSGADVVAAVLSGAVVLGFGLWVFGATRAGGPAWRLVGGAVALAALVGAGVIAHGATASDRAAATAAADPPANARQGDGPWQLYSPAALEAARRAGTPVFVNFTAAWCITCLVNEQVALSTAAVDRRFDEAGVVRLKGDWTRRDPEITAALARFGRSGVPFYVLYPPGAAPVVLPQLLTEDSVLAALADL